MKKIITTDTQLRMALDEALQKAYIRLITHETEAKVGSVNWNEQIRKDFFKELETVSL